MTLAEECVKFHISDHALERWQRGRKQLDRELRRSVPVGAQRGGDILRLLPCGLVAAVTESGVVKTVLSNDHAIGNMQSVGLKVDAPVQYRPVPPSPARSPLAVIAARHAIDGLGRARRNELLREAGYDPCGKDGELYRIAFEAACHVLLHRVDQAVAAE